MLSLILHFYRHLDEYKVFTFNFLAVSISFLETSKIVAKILQIVLLIASVVFTIYKIVELKDKRKKEKDGRTD